MSLLSKYLVFSPFCSVNICLFNHQLIDQGQCSHLQPYNFANFGSLFEHVPVG